MDWREQHTPTHRISEGADAFRYNQYGVGRILLVLLVGSDVPLPEANGHQEILESFITPVSYTHLTLPTTPYV